MKKAFTIVELLMVIAIIGILLGLSVTAVTGAVRKAREQQASACVDLVNQGAEVYYTMNGKWPGPIGEAVANGGQVATDTDKDSKALSADQVRQTVKALVDEARQGRPPMDISGLYVTRFSSGANRPGMDFLSAIHGTRKSGKKMTSGEMWFGYPNDRGYFQSFHAYYYPKTDRLVFTK